MITIKREETLSVTCTIEEGSAQMSENYWKYIGLTFELMNPPPDLCRTEATELDIKRFYRKRVSAMNKLLRSLEADERLLAESYFRISNFSVGRFIEICSENSERPLPGESISDGFQLLDMAADG